MMDQKVDLYIEKSQDFAKPILNHLRELIHKSCPEIQEKIKWNFPCFDYKNSILCSMASFKQHCAFGFWLSEKMDDPEGIFIQKEETAMGQLGRIKTLEDLPSDEILIRYIYHAMDLIDTGVKLSKKDISKEQKVLTVPFQLEQAFRSNDKARSTFEKFSFSNQKEYVTWITDAKTDSTRDKRIQTAIQWLEEGKVKNWKYIK